MVHFVGAGPGAEDLITLRGARLLEEADVIIYAGSLVNPALLTYAKKDCEIYNSATMTLEEVLAVIFQAESEGRTTVRLHTGDPSIYGAIREQIDALCKRGIDYDVTPGVSSLFGAAAALGAEFTLPGISQSVIITREAGKTSVPSGEALELLAAHGATMAIFLSAGMAEKVQADLLAGGYASETPVAVVYKATWPEERVFRMKLSELAETMEREKITKTALILVGDCLGENYEKSRLYAADFSTEFRKAKKE